MHLNNLGSVGYTDFNEDPEDFMKMYEEKPELMDCKAGLIHSHHSMGAFFSGTDQDELHEKAMNGLYLSLIVDDTFTFKAKLAWGGVIERKTHAKWLWTTIGKQVLNQKEDSLEEVVYEMEIDVRFPKAFEAAIARYKHLEFEADKKAKESAKTYFPGARSAVQHGAQHVGGLDYFGDGRQQKMFPDQMAKKIETLSEIRGYQGPPKSPDPFKGDEPELIEVLEDQNLYTEAICVVITNELDFKGDISDAITQFAQECVKAIADEEDFQDVADEEDFQDEVYMAFTSNLRDGKDYLEEMLNDTHIPEEEYIRFVGKMSEEFVGYTGRITDAMRTAVDDYAINLPHVAIPGDTDENGMLV